MAEEHLYFVLLMDRWCNDDVWPVVRDTYFGDLPTGIRHLIAGNLRRGIIKGMKTQGLGRFTAHERLARAEHDLSALTALLDGSPFLFGPRITAADLSVAPMLSGMRATPVQTPLSQRITADPALSAYADRVFEALPLPM